MNTLVFEKTHVQHGLDMLKQAPPVNANDDSYVRLAARLPYSGLQIGEFQLIAIEL